MNSDKLFVGFEIELTEKGYALQVLGVGLTERDALAKKKPTKTRRAICLADSPEMFFWDITDWLVDDVDLVGVRLQAVTKAIMVSMKEIFKQYASCREGEQ